MSEKAAIKKLGKLEWIDAGLRALAQTGVDAVRVERLAQTLKVTKGSFYWHFKDRNALLAALLDAWQAQATNAIIEQVEAQGGDARAKLWALFTIVAKADGRLDRAIRNWAAQEGAAQDPTAQTALEQVDRRRLDYLRALFQGLGFSAAQAAARARLVYHALIGQFMMEAGTTRRERHEGDLEIVFEMLVRRG